MIISTKSNQHLETIIKRCARSEVDNLLGKLVAPVYSVIFASLTDDRLPVSVFSAEYIRCLVTTLKSLLKRELPGNISSKFLMDVTALEIR